MVYQDIFLKVFLKCLNSFIKYNNHIIPKVFYILIILLNDKRIVKLMIY